MKDLVSREWSYIYLVGFYKTIARQRVNHLAQPKTATKLIECSTIKNQICWKTSVRNPEQLGIFQPNQRWARLGLNFRISKIKLTKSARKITIWKRKLLIYVPTNTTNTSIDPSSRNCWVKQILTLNIVSLNLSSNCLWNIPLRDPKKNWDVQFSFQVACRPQKHPIFLVL